MSDKPTLTLSLKGDRQNQPWLVVNAESGDDLAAALSEVTDDLLQQIADASSLFQAALNVAAGTAPVTRAPAPAAEEAPAPAPRQRAAAPEQSSGGYGRKKAVAGTGGRGGKKPKLSYEEASADCRHGERRRFTKPGADWVAYFCPQPKGQDECQANFIDAADDQES